MNRRKAFILAVIVTFAFGVASRDLGAGEGAMPLQRAVVTGTVTDVKTGKPLKSFTVFVTEAAQRGRLVEISKAAMGEGHYEVLLGDARARLAAGAAGTLQSTDSEVAIRVEAYGYRAQVSRTFRLDRPQVIDFALLKWPAPWGQILNADGTPAARAQVFYSEAGRVIAVDQGAPVIAPEWRGETDGSGCFKFKLRPERTSLVRKLPMFALGPTWVQQFDNYLVFVSSRKGYAVVREDAFLKGAAVITLTPWGRVAGRCLVGADPAQGETVRLGAPALPSRVAVSIQPYSEATVDEKGYFTIERVPAGTWMIGRRTPTYQGSVGYIMSHAVPVTVEAGKTAAATIGGVGRPVVGRFAMPEELAADASILGTCMTLDLVVGDGAKADKGRSEGIENAAKAALQREQRALQRRSYSATVSKDGFFRIEDVPTGEYILSVCLTDTSARRGICERVIMPSVPGGRSDEPLDLGTVEANTDLDPGFIEQFGHPPKPPK